MVLFSKQLIFGGLLLHAASSTSDFSRPNPTLWKLFEEFQNKYSVSFKSETEARERFEIFSSNMERAVTLMKKSGGKAQYGPSKFSHLTAEEFKKKYLGYKKNDESRVHHYIIAYLCSSSFLMKFSGKLRFSFA